MIKIILALAHIALPIVFDIIQIKMPLYVLSAFITLIGLYNTNKEFKFVESTFITFVNTYIKGFALELYLHNRHSLLDPKSLKLAFYVLIITVFLGNPLVLKHVARLLDSLPTFKFGLYLSDKVSQSITISNCLYFALTKDEPSLSDICFITVVCFSITYSVVFVGLLESKERGEAAQIISSQIASSIKQHLIAVANVCIWHFYIKQYVSFPYSGVQAIIIIVNTSFIIFYTYKSMHQAKPVEKVKKD